MNFFPIQAFLAGAPGAQELIVLFIVILLLFGPKRLPEIARTIGKTLDQLRKGADDFKDQVMKIDADPLDVDDYSSDDYSSSDDIYTDAESEDYIDADSDDDESDEEVDHLAEESTDEPSSDDEKEDRKDGDDVYG